MTRRLAAVLGILMFVIAACTSSEGTGVAGELEAGRQVDVTSNAAADAITEPPNDEPPSSSSSSSVYETCWTSDVDGAAADALTFADETTASGLEGALVGMRGHAAAWGDVNGDDEVDLLVGTFATSRGNVYAVRGADGPSPDALLVNDGGAFAALGSAPEQYGRTSGAALVDLDGDGDLDAVLSRNVNQRTGGDTTAVLENTGDGFRLADSGIDPDLSGRSIGVLDIDGDANLDLLILEDRYRGASAQLYRNLGRLRFEESSAQFGFPAGVHGLGLAVGDVNDDGWSDVFVAGSNRLFVGTGSGLTEVPGVIPEWPTFGPEDDVSGAAIADVNRDGKLDLVVGHHFNSTLSQGNAVPVRLYLNTSEGGTPSFTDVTEAAGLAGLPTKAPHVELADMNNDGWPDIVTSASAEDGTAPAVFLHRGQDGSTPQFAVPAGLGSPQYWVTGPTADVDRDGRLDLLGVEWEPSLPSILFVNTTPSGNWLEISVNDAVDGVGARVEVYEPGGAGDGTQLIGAREITATVGYTAGVELHAHFGLGKLASADVVVTPARGDAIVLGDVAANQHIRLGGCG